MVKILLPLSLGGEVGEAFYEGWEHKLYTEGYKLYVSHICDKELNCVEFVVLLKTLASQFYTVESVHVIYFPYICKDSKGKGLKKKKKKCF